MTEHEPIIISYADQSFSHFIPYLRQACDAIQTELAVYTPDDIAYRQSSVKRKIQGKLPAKPAIIRQAINEHRRPVVWMDADAFPIAPLSMSWEFDIACTLRDDLIGVTPNAELRYWNQLCNTGVMFVHNTSNARLFLDEVENKIPETKIYSDQEATNLCLIDRGWDEEYGQYDLDGIYVDILTTREYNCFPHVENAKILHFKSDQRKKYRNYYHQYITNATAT
jgi:hypothetical protein